MIYKAQVTDLNKENDREKYDDYFDVGVRSSDESFPTSTELRTNRCNGPLRCNDLQKSVGGFDVSSGSDAGLGHSDRSGIPSGNIPIMGIPQRHVGHLPSDDGNRSDGTLLQRGKIRPWKVGRIVLDIVPSFLHGE